MNIFYELHSATASEFQCCDLYFYLMWWKSYCHLCHV